MRANASHRGNTIALDVPILRWNGISFRITLKTRRISLKFFKMGFLGEFLPGFQCCKKPRLPHFAGVISQHADSSRDLFATRKSFNSQEFFSVGISFIGASLDGGTPFGLRFGRAEFLVSFLVPLLELRFYRARSIGYVVVCHSDLSFPAMN